ALGLGPIAYARADGPTRWRGVRAASTSGQSEPDRSPNRGRSTDAPRDDAISRASQDVPTLLPPSSIPPPSNSMPRQDGSVPSPPVPMEALPGDSISIRPGVDASSEVSIHCDNTDIRQALEIFSRQEKMNLLVSPNVSGPITVNLDG